jgi:1,4-dihydroxy-2-naphthoate octaprenyltransferase
MRLRLNPAATAGLQVSAWRIWFRAIRFHFVPPSFLPAILGSVIAWSRFRVFDSWSFVLVVAGVTINHFGLNMIDDVFDYLHHVDSTPDVEKNPYTGGSGVLTEGLLTVKHMIRGAVACFTVTVLIGFYLAWKCGWPVVLFGVIGMASSLFYTMPPIKFGYRGFGELGLLINFGPIIVLGSYYVQTGTLALEPLFASLILGFMMWSMIIINEIPDYEEDRRGGKWNLVARFGRKAGIKLYTGGLVAAYTILMVSIVLKVTPFLTLFGFASLPLTVKSLRVLKVHYLDKINLIPANLAMIQIHTLTGSSLIVGYLLYGIFRKAV